MNRGDVRILGILRARMPQGARTKHFARGPLGGSYGPVWVPYIIRAWGWAIIFHVLTCNELRGCCIIIVPCDSRSISFFWSVWYLAKRYLYPFPLLSLKIRKCLYSLLGLHTSIEFPEKEQSAILIHISTKIFVDLILGILSCPSECEFPEEVWRQPSVKAISKVKTSILSLCDSLPVWGKSYFWNWKLPGGIVEDIYPFILDIFY